MELEPRGTETGRDMGRGVDPIQAEVVARFLLATAEEMGATLMRTAFSPNIKERADCSTAIFDAQGEVIALAQRVPIHLGSMVGAVDEILQALSASRRSRPATCSSPTIRTTAAARICPTSTSSRRCSSGKRIVAFVANIAHHADVGGMVPGLGSGGVQVDLPGRHPHSAGAHHARRASSTATCST